MVYAIRWFCKKYTLSDTDVVQLMEASICGLVELQLQALRAVGMVSSEHQLSFWLMHALPSSVGSLLIFCSDHFDHHLLSLR